MRQKQKVLIIVGPTSSGKSALAVRLARRFGGEVISADSRQVYRGLDIGTGKITKREMRGVRHHLLDVTSPKSVFTAHQYAHVARRAIEDIAKSGKLPILAGGTGFYVDAVTGRVTLPDAPVNQRFRASLSKKTAPQLFAMLKQRDAARAKAIDEHNKRRLIRALEISVALQNKIEAKSKAIYRPLWIGLRMAKSRLDTKIAARLRQRIRAGLVAEGRRLHRDGLSYRWMEELGLEYRYLARLLQKKLTREEFEQQLAAKIRQFAKRQTTYWRRNKDIHWFDPKHGRAIESAVRAWLEL